MQNASPRIIAGLLIALPFATAISSGIASAQVASVPTVTFEVASVKPNKSGTTTGMRYGAEPRSGRYTAINTPLEILIFSAFGKRSFEIVGLTEWMKSDRFDVIASVGDNRGAPLDKAVMSRMLQALLAERFNLRVHTETRQMPIYRLVFARPDKALGSGIHLSTLDCDAYRLEVERWKVSGRGDPPPIRACGTGFKLSPGTISLRYGGTSISEFAGGLAGDILQRAVVDETGLAGSFDIKLDIAPESFPWYVPFPGAPAPSNNAPYVFEALPAQLGLKLEPGRGPVEILVVDHAEQPTPD